MSIEKVFPLPLKGKYLAAGIWELTAPFKYVNLPDIVSVPTGFQTDGASIPRFAWSLIGSPWSGKYARIAVIHDFLYNSQITTRKKADQIFLDGMKILKVPVLNRRIMHFAVRLFGWMPWDNYKGGDFHENR